MAVVSCKLLFTGRGGTDDFKRHRTYSRTYEVITDDVNDAEQEVGAAAGIPALGTPFDEDTDAVVVSFEAEQSNDSPLIWYVTIKYDSEPPYPEAVDIEGNQVSTADSPENPLLEPAKWRITTQDSEEVAESGIEVDGAGKLIIPNPPAWTANTRYTRNTYVKNFGNVYKCVSVSGDQKSAPLPATGPAGADPTAEIVDNDVVWIFWDTFANTQNDPNRALLVAITHSGQLPFDPPLMTEVSRPVLSVQKNMLFASLAYVMTLKNAVNVVPWKGIPPRCAKVLKIEHDGGHVKNGITYVSTSWEIGLDPDTWDLRALDAGFGCISLQPDSLGTPVRKYVRFTDSKGEPLSEPVPLDGRGQPLEPDQDPVFRRYVPRQTRLIDFNTVLPF